MKNSYAKICSSPFECVNSFFFRMHEVTEPHEHNSKQILLSCYWCWTVESIFVINGFGIRCVCSWSIHFWAFVWWRMLTDSICKFKFVYTVQWIIFASRHRTPSTQLFKRSSKRIRNVTFAENLLSFALFNNWNERSNLMKRWTD